MTQTIYLGDLLSNKEVATLLGIKPNTLEIWRHQGKGPPFCKIGDSRQSTVRYLRSVVIGWIAQRSFTSTSEYSVAVRTTQDGKYGVKTGKISSFCPTHLPASSKPRDV